MYINLNLYVKLFENVLIFKYSGCRIRVRIKHFKSKNCIWISLSQGRAQPEFTENHSQNNINRIINFNLATFTSATLARADSNWGAPRVSGESHNAYIALLSATVLLVLWQTQTHLYISSLQNSKDKKRRTTERKLFTNWRSSPTLDAWIIKHLDFIV